MPDTLTLHGTCVAVDGKGVLILGPPGAGKSDLALRLIDQPGLGLTGLPHPAHLVADDQVMLVRHGSRLLASAPPAIAGQMEIRGLGIVTLRHEEGVPLRLAVRLTEAAAIERLPDLAGSGFEALGLSLPLVEIDPSSASAPSRLRAALDWLCNG